LEENINLLNITNIVYNDDIKSGGNQIIMSCYKSLITNLKR
jgi:hypothetical protein